VPLRLDVLDQAAIAQLAAAHGPFDVLMNCADFVHDGTILDCSPEDWAFSMRLDVESSAAPLSRTARRHARPSPPASRWDGSAPPRR